MELGFDWKKRMSWMSGVWVWFDLDTRDNFGVG